MKTRKDTPTISQNNLGTTDREVRVLVGAGLIAAVMFYDPSPMGMWPILALVAIPFVITGLIGWDPLYALLGITTDKQHDEDIHQHNWSFSNIGMLDRVIRFIGGAALIGLTLSGELVGWELLAALAAVPIIISAIIAWDPFYALTNSNTFASRHDVEMANTELREETVAKLYDFPTQSPHEETSGHHGKAA